MSLYYRLTDEQVLDLNPSFVDGLAQSKRDTLKAYSVDPQPTPTSLQLVLTGPVVVDATTARQTWLLVDKSPLQLEAEAFALQQNTQLELAVQVYTALKNGTGTAAERLARVERVCAHYLRSVIGSEPE